MFPLILNYISASIIMLSLVVAAEVLINFKRPVLLKIMFLFVALGFMYRSTGSIYCSYNGYNRWLVDFPDSVIATATLCFFSILYQYRIKWFVIIFGLVIILLQLILLTYFTFVHPIDVSIALRDIPVLGNYIRIIKAVLVTISLLITIYTFVKILQKYKSENLYFAKLRAWSVFILATMAFHWVGNMFKFRPGIWNIGEIIIPMGNFFALLLILFRPRFLNRTNLKISLGDFFTKKMNPELDDHLFMESFFTQTYYLNKEASAEHLGRQLNISSEILNSFIYSRYGSGFTDLVNKHRVAYFIDLVNTGNYNDYTIDALAQEAGFSSRHHLYKPFKKFHGGTPSDFMRSISV